MKLSKVVTIEDLHRAARRRLPRIAFDFIEGGVEDERGIERNELAFSRYRLLPRYFVDVSARSQATRLFGKSYDSPFGICPTGVAGLFRAKADNMLAQVAAKSNIPFVLSTAGTGEIETLVRLAPKHMWFQLYGARDRSISDRLVERVRKLGVETLVITADVPVVANRERNMRNGFRRPLRWTPSIVLDGLSHPRWLLDYWRVGGGMPRMETWAAYAKPGASADEIAEHYGTQAPSPEQTWADVERVRKAWPGNLVIKGILHPKDAARAAEIGADGLIISNHGGRQLDPAPTPLEVLPAIRAAVGPGMPLMLDGGIRRGTDILIALSLGIQFVFVGRATLYGVAAYGLAGAQRAVDILKREIDVNMAQIGCARVDALGLDNVAMPASSLIIGSDAATVKAADRQAAEEKTKVRELNP